MRSKLAIVFAASLLVVNSLKHATAFLPQQCRVGCQHQHDQRIQLRSTNAIQGEVDTSSYILSREEVNPILTFGKDDKEKVVNAFGMWCLVVSLITGPIWMLAMKLVHKMENDENRAMYDMTGKIWSKTWLTMCNSYPTITGNREYLAADNHKGACLFVANHASWLDIPVLCTVLDPVFKFIAKGELMKVPCIGTQLEGVGSMLEYLLVATFLSRRFHDCANPICFLLSIAGRTYHY